MEYKELLQDVSYFYPIITYPPWYEDAYGERVNRDVPMHFSDDVEKDLDEYINEKPGLKKVIDILNDSLPDEFKFSYSDFRFRISEYNVSYVPQAGNTHHWNYSCVIGLVNKTDGIETFRINYEYDYSYTSQEVWDDITEEYKQVEVDNDESEVLVYDASTMKYENIESIATQLQGSISTWYFILRNLALLVLMIVLIYIGIRIVIGSTAGEKAKYKERLMDWLVSLCLIFIMHYIMAFSINIVEKATELIDSIDNSGIEYLKVPLTDRQKKNIEKMEEESEDSQQNALAYEALKNNGQVVEDAGPDENGDLQDELWWKTDLMGKMKVQSQILKEGTAKWVGYSICYLLLTLFTLFFSFTYMKRVVYMAFLTIIAPLVAMTYPIDKITDGRAQAFEMWLKEYIFNLLIQPMHLLLYIILVSAAYELASTNALYAIVAIGFMIPAEKLIRRFFGFTKAQTPGMLGGAAGAALGFTGLQKLMRFGNKKRGKEHKENKDNGKIKFSSGDSIDEKAVVAEKSMKKDGKGDKVEKEKSSSKVDTVPTLNSAENGKAQSRSKNSEGDNASGTKTTDKLKYYENANWFRKTGYKIRQSKFGQTKGGKAVIKGASTIGAGIGAYGRGLGKKLTRRVNNARPIRALARGVAGAYGAVTLGMAGTILGVTSGDPSKAFQYGTAGLAGGYSMGKGLAGKTLDSLHVNGNDINDAMEMTWAGDEYKQKKLKQQQEELATDENSISYLQQTMGLSRFEAQQVLKTTGATCLANNISNVEDIAAIEKMVNDGVDIDVAMAGQKFNGYLPKNLKQMGESEREDSIAQWKKEYEEGGYADSRYLAERSMEIAEKFNKAKASLKKA